MASRAAPTEGVFVWNVTTANVVGVSHERENIVQAVVKNGLVCVQKGPSVGLKDIPPKTQTVSTKVEHDVFYIEWNEEYVCLIRQVVSRFFKVEAGYKLLQKSKIVHYLSLTYQKWVFQYDSFLLHPVNTIWRCCDIQEQYKQIVFAWHLCC